jgi:hypothetical protein
MTAQALEFDGPRGYRLAGRLKLPDDRPAAALVGRGTFNVPSAGAANRRALGHYHDLVMEPCNA